MKRKKWTELEESSLIGEYSALLSSGSLSQFHTREKKFQPIADRVNARHHLRDPSAFPFLWSWRDVSVKIQNMRHQFLGVKHKILLRPASSSPSSAAPAFDWDAGLHLWPNFLLYKHVFGDVDLHSDGDELPPDDDEENDEIQIQTVHNAAGTPSSGIGRGGRLAVMARRVLDLGEAAARREESRREREEEGQRRRRWEEDSRERWRRREERRNEEEMEWRERLLVMQMEHEKQVMQMHADACQGQMQVSGILARLAYQFLGSGACGGSDGGIGGPPPPQHQVLHGLHRHEQHSPGSLVGDGAKDDARSSDHYL